MKCPICECSNSAERIKYTMNAHPIPGVDIPVSLDAISCSHCGEESETPEVTASNDKLLAEARLEWMRRNRAQAGKNLHLLLKDLRKVYGLSQAQLTKLINASPNAISKYERGEVAPSGVAATMIKMLAFHPETIDLLTDLSAPPKVRRDQDFSIDFVSISASISAVAINILQEAGVAFSRSYDIISRYATNHSVAESEYDVTLMKDNDRRANSHTRKLNIQTYSLEKYELEVDKPLEGLVKFNTSHRIGASFRYAH